jgi:hypothetical protein
MDMQYFPTPDSLARKAWAKFQNKDIVRILEPSAGEGHLLEVFRQKESYSYKKSTPVDCVEFDITRHAILRANGYNVVGVDFMQFGGASLYSHIIMNPPFSEGAKHVLKAWEMLFDGELVAILNAESIRNPFSSDRQMLLRLIEQHGSVEYLQEEFLSDEAERKTSVEIALVHLTKSSNFEMNFLAGLEVDDMTASGLASGYKEYGNEVAMHNSMVENSVLAFNAAVKAARELVFAAARARYYSSILGSTMETLQSKASNISPGSEKANLFTVRREMQEQYDDLKNRAWTQILRSSQFTSRLSSKAQRRLEAEFENVKQLEFTVANIYGFILGLIEKQSEINIEMACDVFDSITKHHSDNRVYYKGWKSNDKHRTSAYRVKMTRFVIPGNRNDGWRSTPDWDTCRFLADFDKVFAMLDGKSSPGASNKNVDGEILPDTSLEGIFNSHYMELRNGNRVSSDYFDIRHYPGAGTIHFFPTNKKLIDRFNRLVGRHRNWLPPEGETVPEAFWLQYEKAEKFATEVQSEISKLNRSRSFWGGLERDIHSSNGETSATAVTAIDSVLDIVLERHGIHPASLANPAQQQAALPFLEAA